MTEKQKIQLFNSQVLLVAVLLLPLVCFFVVATTLKDDRFFHIISAGLVLTILYLIPLRMRLLKTKASVDLQVQDSFEHMNLMEAGIQREDKAIHSFGDKIVNYSQLKGLTERLSMCLSLEDTTRTLSSEVDQLFGEKDTTIILYLFHSKTGELGISSSHKGQMRVNLKDKKGDAFDQWVVKTMQPLLIEDTSSDYRFDIDKIQTEDARSVRSLVSSPLMVGNKALGILRVDSPKEDYFKTEDLRFLKTIADLGALATENAQLYERIEQLAIKDSLTQLYLRRHLLDRLPEEIARHMRRKANLSFLMIDLDHFKKYNDKFGHIAGDIVLKTVGTMLSEFFNVPGSLVCRYGGEEFSVLLPECSKEKAVELAEEMRKKIEKQTILLRREKTHVTISVGVATFPKDAQLKDELIHKADQALYKAKTQGRNCVCST